MKKLATSAVVFLLLLTLIRTADARRGNPANYNTSSAKYQFYILDSDDNDPRSPSYDFVDTLYDPTHWKRVAFGSSQLVEISPQPDSMIFQYYANQVNMPFRYISRNGIVTTDTFSNPPTINTSFPTTTQRGIVAPLWGDMEFRGGDSSKVFYRLTAAKDSFYVTYYNLFLKGTNGQVRSTFQIAVAKVDTSITFNYRSFDGSFAGVSAAAMFQKLVTIGLQNYQGLWSSTYLDQGIYHAKSYSSQIYAQNLHNNLAVRFFPNIPNHILLKSIDFPPKDGYEVSSQNFTPTVTIENLKSQSRMVYFQNKIQNLNTGAQVYSRTDSFVIGFNEAAQRNGTTNQALQCGTYRLTTTVWIPSLGTDAWEPDNTMSRDFVYLNTASVPYFDDYSVLDPCYWHSYGANWVSNAEGLYDQPGPTATGSVLLNRKNSAALTYISDVSSDTLVFAPINLSGKSNVWMSISYQRGASTDSTIAGVTNRTLVGPELVMTDSNKAVIRGDSLIIEALASSGSKLNPAESSWVQIGKLYGGLDLVTKKFRVQIPSAYVHDHTRVRFRLAASNDAPLFTPIPPVDDNDNWVLDAFEINAATGGQTDLEPIGVDLGAGVFTHIPRDVKFLSPKVTISNNGIVTNLGSYPVKLIIQDALHREVYHKTQSIYQPPAHGDTTITFPQWQIEGSQGGVFTCKIFVSQNFNEIRRQNDTATFYRTLFIDDRYAYDDGTGDTSGTMVAADLHNFIDLRPLSSDSLRGFDFYHLSLSGTTNWSVTIRDTNGHSLATRSIFYNVNANTGYQRASVAPFFMVKDSVYRIEFNMTQGSSLGGDGSRGLVLKARIEKGPTPKYAALYPTLLPLYRDANGTQYYTKDSLVRNGVGGGPIVPMIRFIFTGSSVFLPVELASFDAKRTATGSVVLNFRTAKEENVSSFIVERSTNDGWVEAGTLKAANARLGSDYSLVDNTAPTSTLTYRLTEVDLDGSHTINGYANVGALSSEIPLSVQVMPNPATTQVHAAITGVNEFGATVKLYDMLGKAVASATISTDGPLDLDASSLAAGRYILEVITGTSEIRTPVIIQK